MRSAIVLERSVRVRWSVWMASVRSYKETSLANTYAQLGALYNGFYQYCDGDACAPGFACNKEHDHCDIPLIGAKKGDNFFDTAGSAKVRNFTLFLVCFELQRT